MRTIPVRKSAVEVFQVTRIKVPAPTPSIILCMSFSKEKEYLTFILLFDTLAKAFAYRSSSRSMAPNDATVSAKLNASSAHPLAIP